MLCVVGVGWYTCIFVWRMDAMAAITKSWAKMSRLEKRGSWIWRGWLVGVISWKWEFSFHMCTCGRCVVVMRSECCVV